jgi:hypothetical protein
MLEIINTLRQVETGEYNGIGKQLVALSAEVALPEGITKPENDSGLGIVSKYLGASALETAQGINVNLFSPIENGKIVDMRMLAWLLVGRKQRLSDVRSADLGNEKFVFTADKIMVVTSAAKYGIDCNGLDSVGASSNWNETLKAYQKLVKDFYPESEASTTYETLWPGGLGIYPSELVRAAKECCEADDGLSQTAEMYGAGPDAFVNYMLSHTQAFRDYQITPEAPFVVKVGAPSELRFSRWQKLAIEQALPLRNGFVPNMVVTDSNGKKEYGQVSLYYPRLGNRPPYYADSVTEPTLYGKYPANFEDFLWSIPDGDPSLRRYADLQNTLLQTRVRPEEYLELFAGGI